MAIKLLILDFDGTLADTRSLIVSIIKAVAAERGLPVPTDEAAASTIGLPLKTAFITLFSLTEAEGQACAEHYCRIFDERNKPGVVKLYPHVADTLALLHSRGLTITIASSRHHASLADYVRGLGLEPYVSLVLGADDVAEAKPSPEPVLHTLRLTGFRPEEAMVVGDAAYDILMGRRAGTRTVGVTYGNGSAASLTEAGADHLADDFSEVAKYVN